MFHANNREVLVGCDAKYCFKLADQLREGKAGIFSHQFQADIFCKTGMQYIAYDTYSPVYFLPRAMFNALYMSYLFIFLVIQHNHLP